MNIPPPVRYYEPNILRNPFTWMGIWTPQGWRTHRKRFGRAVRKARILAARKGQTRFPGALRGEASGKVEWQDDLHLTGDPFTDGGIYPCDPRVEYPAGTPRWSVSHSVLCFPVADHSLHTHEYTWDMASGDLAAHFRRRVALEECRTDAKDGRTVRVSHAPISQVIEGNVAYDVPNSAVRGVWQDPKKKSANLYARRAVQQLEMLNGTYLITPHQPVLQCRGVWQLLPEDPADSLFDAQTGDCRSIEAVIDKTNIPLDEPKIALFLPRLEPRESRLYETDLGMLAEPDVRIDESRLDHLRKRLGVRFDPSQAGYAGGNCGIEAGGGYFPEFDFNDNGVIDDEDLRTLSGHLGRTVRSNLYVHSYFGPDWLSICVALDAEQRPGSRVLADYDYGAGYDSRSGTIRLFETPGPNQPVWVEYYYDAPIAEEGDEVVVHTYEEI